jgi:hypothetical protein
VATVLSRLEQARFFRECEIDAVLAEFACEPVPAVGREAELKSLDGRGQQRAPLDIRPRRRGLGRAQPARKICDGDFVRGVDLLLFAAHASRRGRLRFDLDPGPPREEPHGFGEREILESRDEGNHVAARAATEAFEEAAIGVDVKRRRLLAMKRAQAHEVVAAFGQLYVRSDEGTDIGAREDLAAGGLIDERHRLLRHGSVRQGKKPLRAEQSARHGRGVHIANVSFERTR